MIIPLDHKPSTPALLHQLDQSHANNTHAIKLLTWQQLACIFVGVFYPALILVAIIATANHFVLDAVAVAGAIVGRVVWRGMDVLLNLLVVEYWFSFLLSVLKPKSGILMLL